MKWLFRQFERSSLYIHTRQLDNWTFPFETTFIQPLCIYLLLIPLFNLSAVTSAMRKNSRWSGISVSGLHMGSLGMSMGLRSGLTSGKDGNYRNQVSHRHGKNESVYDS